MLVMLSALAVLLSATDVLITEPEHCTAYNLDELPSFRAIVENENATPDSVVYTLNGSDAVLVNRLNTDWHTYMQDYSHHGYSESPAPTDNTILWTAPITGFDHEFPTPVVVNGIVYYPSNSGTDSLYALDAATGNLMWKYQVGDNSDDAVTIMNERVYCASDSIFCLNALTGELIWASGEADYSGSTPVVTEGRVYCGWTDMNSGGIDSSCVVCLDDQDGELLWSTTLYTGRTVSCLTVWDGIVIVPVYWSQGFPPNTLYALDSINGETIWTNSDEPDGYWDSSPVIVNDIIYIAGMSASRAIDLQTGSSVWVSSASGATATLAYHDDRLYYGDVTYYCLDSVTGDVHWTGSGIQHGSSALADGMVFYGQFEQGGTSGGIRVLSCESGAEVWSFFPPDTYWIAGSPSIVDGVVYMPMHDGNLYAFGTGLKYTYTAGQLDSVVGWNELVATSYNGGETVACDTISYYINQTGIEINPSLQFGLRGSPNPFCSSITLSFNLEEASLVLLAVYDLSGRKVADLIREPLSSGSHTVNWDGIRENGQVISSGLYQCRIQSGSTVETTGLCVLR